MPPQWKVQEALCRTTLGRESFICLQFYNLCIALFLKSDFLPRLAEHGLNMGPWANIEAHGYPRGADISPLNHGPNMGPKSKV